MNLTEHTIFELARMADCSDPDSPTSPGAHFLSLVESSVAEAVEYGITDDLSDVAHEIADGCVPVYTHELWATFVDLAAWNVDTSDLGQPKDMEEGARWALYTIANTLAFALLPIDEN